jgi:hypothetical protein
VSSSSAIHYPSVEEIYKSNDVINWVAFGPSGQYVVDTDKRLYYACPAGMMRKHEGGVAVELRCASFGHNGAWVCVEEDGKIRSQGLSDNIKAALDKKAVRVSRDSASASVLTTYHRS